MADCRKWNKIVDSSDSDYDDKVDEDDREVSRAILNSLLLQNETSPPASTPELSKEERDKICVEFCEENRSLIREFGTLQKYSDSMTFLMRNTHLVQENTIRYLLGWSLDLEVNGLHDVMLIVAHQVLCLHNIIDMYKHVRTNVEACISTVLKRMRRPELDKEMEIFIETMDGKAKQECYQVLKARRYGDPKQLGPGGLDPEEVMLSLPLSLKIGFELHDTDLLKEAINKIEPPSLANDYMNRSVAAGLWILDGEEFGFPFPAYNKEGVMVDSYPLCQGNYDETP